MYLESIRGILGQLRIPVVYLLPNHCDRRLIDEHRSHVDCCRNHVLIRGVDRLEEVLQLDSPKQSFNMYPEIIVEDGFSRGQHSPINPFLPINSSRALIECITRNSRLRLQ